MHVIASGQRVDTLFLHGVAGSAWTFDATLRSWQPGGWACVDLLGYGESSWLEDADYSSARQAAALVALLDQLRLEQVSVVGFSWGGLIGLELAVRDPRVKRLALVDIAPSSNQPETAVPPLPRHYDSMAAVKDTVRMLAPRAAEAVVDREAFFSTRPRSGGGYERRMDPALLERWQFRGEDHWESLEKVDCDVLVVRAEHSPLLDAQTADQMVSRCRGASARVIADTGHLIPLERPQPLAGVLSEFLD
jgi:pimeloyl-ACP methyl ester carboxylesterase